MPRFKHLPVLSLQDVTLVLEQLEPLVFPGAWTNPEGFSAKLEETTSAQVRSEQGATVARLKGTVKAKEGIPALTTLFTLPAGLRPSVTMRLAGIDTTANTLQVLLVFASGVVQSTEITAAHVIGFDGITFNLT